MFLVYCDKLTLLSLICDTHETNIQRQTSVISNFLYIEVFTQVPWTSIYPSFTVYNIYKMTIMVKSWYPERYPCFGRHQACGLVFPYIKYGCYSPNCRDYQLIIDKVLWVLIPNPLKQWDSCFSHSTVEYSSDLTPYRTMWFAAGECDLSN